jgi:hypothetical protein
MFGGAAASRIAAKTTLACAKQIPPDVVLWKGCPAELVKPEVDRGKIRRIGQAVERSPKFDQEFGGNLEMSGDGHGLLSLLQYRKKWSASHPDDILWRSRIQLFIGFFRKTLASLPHVSID